MKRLTVIMAMLAIVFAANAERVSYKDAEKVARAYYYQTVNAFRATEWSDISLTCVVNPNDANPKYNLYIFDVNDDGYIIVSSDDQIVPVLAYSFECSFNMNNMSPGQAAYLKYYSESNDRADKTDAELVEANRAEWNYLLTYDPLAKATRDVVTSPVLMEGIVWEQGWPFNAMCPEKTNSYHNHAPVGCVATATCHVMKYWNWPATGNGSYTHISSYNGGNGNITVNFGNQTYNWYSMPDDPSSAENAEVAKICFHVGVAVKMYWEADGSGSQTWNIPTALKNYFRYASEVEYKSKRSYSDANWNSMLKSQIDQKYPMVYSGTSTTTGHAWNCDGYQINGSEEKFHMKWGWGLGDGSGFYTLDNLNSSATINGPENNFVDGQEVVINIHPNQTFSGCENVTVTGVEGTFDDGSRIYDYSNNKDCSYVINPECGAYTTLKFPKFDLANGDYVNIYKGSGTTGELIATYDADNLPPTSLSSLATPVTVRFVTDGSAVSDGWKINYSTIYCSMNTIEVTEASGTFGDGSKACQYKKLTTCSWKVAPAGASSITFRFTDFNVSSDGKDYVAFFHDAIHTDNLIVKYSSENVPRDPVTFPYGTVYVKFYSNNNDDLGDGWTLTYSSSANSVEDIEIMSNLSVVPNPANGDARIAFTLTDASNTTITITNMLGQVVGQKQFSLESGYHEISFENFSNLSLQNQMYFVTLQNENQIKTCKFLFTK
ncbi:MAG: C10 family peptidase [Bacteroidales bacterium]|nr:C10 family peptidase [Bacteroidales bacterium]